jgi:hypothetical protein
MCDLKGMLVQIFTASLDKTIKNWTIDTGECEASYDVGLPIASMVSVGPDVFVLSAHWREGQAGRVGTFNVATKAFSPFLKLKSPASTLHVSPSSQYVATFERNTVHVMKPHDEAKLTFKMIHTRNVTVRRFLWSSRFMILKSGL